MDDLGALFAFRFSLLGHGPQHRLGQVNLLHFHVGDLYAIRRGVLVENALDAGVQLVPVGQQFIQFNFTQDGAQSGLRELLRLVVVVGHLHHGLRSIEHAPVNNGIYLQRDVVAGDDVLGRDFERLLAHVDADDPVDGAKHQDHAGTFGVLEQAAQAEDHAAFVLAQDLNGTEDVENEDYDNDENKIFHNASVQLVCRVERILWHGRENREEKS